MSKIHTTFLKNISYKHYLETHYLTAIILNSTIVKKNFKMHEYYLWEINGLKENKVRNFKFTAGSSIFLFNKFVEIFIIYS